MLASHGGQNMAQAPAPLLERLPIFQSRDADETSAFLRGKGYGFDLPPQHAHHLDARINGVYFPGFYIGYVQYGATSVALSPGQERKDYWMQLPLRGHLEAAIGHDTVACDSSRAAIASPTHENCRFLSEPDSTRIQLALNGAAINAQLGALLGEPADTPLNFAAAIDLTTGYGRSLARYLHMAVADLEQAGSVLWKSLTIAAFEQFVMTALLLSHPHNHSGALRRLERPMGPRDIKRALDFMQSNSMRRLRWSTSLPRQAFRAAHSSSISRIGKESRLCGTCGMRDSGVRDKCC
jgi:hypothetical protein